MGFGGSWISVVRSYANGFSEGRGAKFHPVAALPGSAPERDWYRPARGNPERRGGLRPSLPACTNLNSPQR
ncbi:MAG: hypothetical protein RL077_556 [Verrucomicrobiota bacterium]|jgi:hypothetical protein